MAKYITCPYCGSNTDHGEKCDCQRKKAEQNYYSDNNCFPRPAGYFGTETDAHFDER